MSDTNAHDTEDSNGLLDVAKVQSAIRETCELWQGLGLNMLECYEVAKSLRASSIASISKASDDAKRIADLMAHDEDDVNAFLDEVRTANVSAE